MRLSRLVRNLLDMTRFEAFGLALRAAPTSVEGLVGSVLARFEGRPLTTKVPFGLEVHGDAVLLAQALIHLVENAVKRSPATEPIHVEARQRGGLLEIDVADRGARVSDRDEPSLLQKTFRAHETEGGRVGWTVARGIAEAHGGSLAVLDREGGGAVFRMSLPATPRTAAES
jgi:two-component system sensor histidine kinase KdpD